MKFKKIGALLLSAVLCIGMAAPAFAYGDDTAPVEQPVLPEVVEEDVVTITDETTGALTPEGNLTLVDDYHTNYSDGSGQQFITLVSKSGATFYLVIDRNANSSDIIGIVDGSFLMDYDDAGQELQFKSAAAISIMYTILERCGFEPEGYFDRDDFQAIYDFSTPDAV